jgi:peptidoglycan/xylan/chitin deacetylase (PgdA/CDA1 family)
MRKAIILCYHKVGPVAEEGRRLNIEPERLKSHVRYFSRRSFTFLRARDLDDRWPERGVCFTFDDAYTSTMRHAPPVLEEFGVRGSFYAVSDKVGLASDWDGALARPLADWQALLDAHRKGHEIGNHTRSHQRLAELSYEDQLRQIKGAHQALEAFELEPRTFCYPYGSLCSPDVLSQAGYAVGLALGKRIATQGDDLRALPRIIAAYSDSLPMLLYKIYVRPRLRAKN